MAGRVAGGATVTFRPSGSSMVPLIRSRRQVIVAPVDPSKVEVGDIVLARVAGTVYLHLVSSVDLAGKRVQISNNRGWPRSSPGTAVVDAFGSRSVINRVVDVDEK
ncbi:S26 family signal peptidase [Streptomyces sp. NPDC057499]|uniref:S26 family signal peptidase n=1 Tax=Streptomyces sp. NPDC057499 TaxID=3346150 RepID=UPI003673AF14